MQMLRCPIQTQQINENPDTINDSETLRIQKKLKTNQSLELKSIPSEVKNLTGSRHWTWQWRGLCPTLEGQDVTASRAPVSTDPGGSSNDSCDCIHVYLGMDPVDQCSLCLSSPPLQPGYQIKKVTEGINSRIEQMQTISQLKDRLFENTQKRKKMVKGYGNCGTLSKLLGLKRY